LPGSLRRRKIGRRIGSGKSTFAVACTFAEMDSEVNFVLLGSMSDSSLA